MEGINKRNSTIETTVPFIDWEIINGLLQVELSTECMEQMDFSYKLRGLQCIRYCKMKKADLQSHIDTHQKFSPWLVHKESIAKYPAPDIYIVSDYQHIPSTLHYWTSTESVYGFVKKLIEDPQTKEASGFGKTDYQMVKNVEPTANKTLVDSVLIDEERKDAETLAAIDRATVKSKRRLLNIRAKRIEEPASEDLGSQPTSQPNWIYSAVEKFTHTPPYKDANFSNILKELDFCVQTKNETKHYSQQYGWSDQREAAVQCNTGTDNAPNSQYIDYADSLANFLTETERRVSDALQQNEEIDMLQNDFQQLQVTKSTNLSATQETLLLLLKHYDANYCKSSSLVDLDCAATECYSFSAAAYSQLGTASGHIEAKTSYILVWSVQSIIEPHAVLVSLETVTKISFCPYDERFIVGGCVNGQVAIWKFDADLTRVKRESNDSNSANLNQIHPFLVSEIGHAHKNFVTDIQWIPRNATVSHSDSRVDQRGAASFPVDSGNFGFVTSANESYLLIWQIEQNGNNNLTRPLIPVKKVLLKASYPEANSKNCSLLLFTQKSTEGTNFWLALDQEELITGRGTLTDKNSKNVQKHVNGEMDSRQALVLTKSPFLEDTVLTVNDWEFHIWQRDKASAAYSSPVNYCHYSCGCWSSSRPGVLYIGRMDGVIEVWDLIGQSMEPIITFQVSSKALNNVQTHFYKTAKNSDVVNDIPDPSRADPESNLIDETVAADHFKKEEILIIGDWSGDLQVFKLPRYLQQQEMNELKKTSEFLDAEHSKLQHWKKKKNTLQKKAKEGRGPKVPKRNSKTDDEDNPGIVEKLEVEYRAMERKFTELLLSTREVEG